ncbi:hypothetical protein [Streptomyces spectabilis]|uniref:Uncharacterized protein n=1 Tax=Streptomyces spectabilis TaxID=68270 RepID=A0A7W8B2X7_STRST|nr:hypothetical protein [Streptomyces spectabilis]MBB5109321.1 hypothetical protein [Streptomyces spectabilis]GGV52404.1 hypothetical protein GCM10010245_82500 [Streptomyces spectabilis]
MKAPLTEPVEVLAEMPTAAPWCQRWRQRKHSWRHVREGGFDAQQYEVHVIEDRGPAKNFVLAHHYSASWPAAKMQFGLYREQRLFGVAVFGVPVSAAVLTRPFPELRPYTESLVCSRFVLLDECPGNSESWFLARCFENLVATGVRGVVSFADPVPRRTAAGVLVMPGHVGTIYAASNAMYVGRTAARTVKLLPDGTLFHDRTAQKIRRQEEGHEYAEAQLIALGAPVPRADCDPAVWLREALTTVGARNIRHRGAHRFCGRYKRVAAWPPKLPEQWAAGAESSGVVAVRGPRGDPAPARPLGGPDCSLGKAGSRAAEKGHSRLDGAHPHPIPRAEIKTPVGQSTHQVTVTAPPRTRPRTVTGPRGADRSVVGSLRSGT